MRAICRAAYRDHVGREPLIMGDHFDASSQGKRGCEIIRFVAQRTNETPTYAQKQRSPGGRLRWLFEALGDQDAKVVVEPGSVNGWCGE
jgi:hypothetical protein